MKRKNQNKHKRWLAFKAVSPFLNVVPVILLLFLPFVSTAQVTKIMGQVVDSRTREPIPFANIIINQSLQGTLTDFAGNYSLEISGSHGDSIRASLLGYEQVTKVFVPGKFQTINFELSFKDLDLPEVTIVYTGNPADAIIDSIIKNKVKNTFQSYETKQYDAYTKIQLDANNVTERIINRKIMKPFNFILDYVDTSTMTGKSYLPVMIAESNSVIYERKSPKAKKEIIMASKISGLETTNVSQFLGSMAQEVNIYDNHTEIVEKNFVSPIANSGHDYYKYYLVDSSFIKKRWCYHIMFKPKRKQELTYTGSLWVNDTSYAIIEVKMRIADDANINFINYMEVEQEYEWVDNRLWLKTKDKIAVDFNAIENAVKVIGIYGRKTVFQSNYKFDLPTHESVFKHPVDVISMKISFRRMKCIGIRSGRKICQLPKRVFIP